jgi:Na+/proline symporter
MLSYFGCDQSQVQRYLTAKSVDSARHSLLVSAFAKIPLQAGILLTGVLTFCFFLFNKNPMLFNPVYERTVLASQRAGEYRALETEFDRRFDARAVAAQGLAAAQSDPSSPAYATAREAFRSAQTEIAAVRSKAVTLVREVTGDKTYTDTNYVFPTFILSYMPIGLMGLMIAAILSAAMSASSGELNALATATAIDVYRRHINPTAPDAAFLRFSKMSTAFWGLFACVAAYYSANLGSLIDTVNKIGSLFYGSILGVFILALGVKPANGHGAFFGLIAGLVSVFIVSFHPETKTISYLWHNVIGAVVCVGVGTVISLATRSRGPAPAPPQPTP